MSVFSNTEFDGHEQVSFFSDDASGLKGIIAVHDTSLGPAFGGTRMWDYGCEAEALEDVLRLSRGMTYKSALAGLDFGGGKSVIIGNSKSQKSEQLFRAFGKAVDRLGGSYVAAEDVGTSVEDLEWARLETRHIAGISEGNVGDPSPATAWGVFNAIKASAAHKYGTDDLSRRAVAVQGLGSVGLHLCRHLHGAGASLVVTDIYKDVVQRAVDEFGATPVDSERILDQAVDIFAPCALGAVINDDAVRRLQADIVAGSANNQLAHDHHGDMLKDKGILYAPDYVANAGGIIIIGQEGNDFNRAAAMNKVAGIYDTLEMIYRRAERENINPEKIADKMAQERIAQTRHRKQQMMLAS